MSEWPLVSLGECLRQPPDYGANAAAVPLEGGLPRYVRITDVADDGTLLPEGAVGLPREAADGALLEAGDLLFARSGATVGKTYLYAPADGECAFAGYLIRFRTDPAKLLPEFLSRYTRSRAYWRWVGRTAHAGAQPNISAQEYMDLPVPGPGTREQEAIVKTLKAWEGAQRKLVAVIRAKHRFKRGLAEQLLTGKRRFKEFEQQPWRVFKIGDLLEEVSRPIEWNDNAFYDLVSIRRRSGGVFHRSRTQGGAIKTKQLFEVHEGDFLISRMQVVHGALGLVPAHLDGMSASGSYVVLRNKDPELLDIEFFDQLTRLPQMYRQALLASYGVHIEKMTFNLDWYLKATIRIPSSIEEQTAITRTLTALDREAELLEALRDALDRQRRGVAERLLTGKVRIPA